jgi:hypothetical protein
MGLALLATALAGGCGDSGFTIPTVYLVGGKVVDPAANPAAPIAGARVLVETAPGVAAVTTAADGIFLLHGLPAGTHRLRVEAPGRVPTLSTDLVITDNLVGALVPLFTRGQIDSVLAARGAPAWDDDLALFGLFALRSNGLPLGDAGVDLSPDPAGSLQQTGAAEDPIVLVNARPGTYALRVSRTGFVWDDPIQLVLRPGTVTFGAPRARPNLMGFVFESSLAGPAIAGAVAAVASGPTAAADTTTSLGQFALVGLVPGRYVARITHPGFLPGLTWPRPLQQDTTLVHALIRADTLAAWAAAAGVAPPSANRGHLAVDARFSGVSGFPLELTLEPAAGRALPPRAGVPAIVLDVPPGSYRLTVRATGHAELVEEEGVVVRAGEITYAQLDF